MYLGHGMLQTFHSKLLQDELSHTLYELGTVVYTIVHYPRNSLGGRKSSVMVSVSIRNYAQRQK